MWQRIYKLDFVEPKILFNNVMIDKLEEIFYEDENFLRIMDEQTIKVGNHNRTPLPFRNPAMMFSNNQRMVEKRVQYLKRHLKGIESISNSIKILWMKLSVKGDVTSQNGRVWYLPRHGVYHPLKPEKIWAIFD